MTEHPSLIKSKNTEDKVETEKIATELLKELEPIVNSRKKLRETEEEVKNLLATLSAKFDSLTELKKENVQLEREVLEKIKRQLPP